MWVNTTSARSCQPVNWGYRVRFSINVGVSEKGRQYVVVVDLSIAYYCTRRQQKSNALSTVVVVNIIIIVYYATQATHRKHAQNIETIKHEKTKSTKTKMTKTELWYNILSQTLLLS